MCLCPQFEWCESHNTLLFMHNLNSHVLHNTPLLLCASQFLLAVINGACSLVCNSSTVSLRKWWVRFFATLHVMMCESEGKVEKRDKSVLLVWGWYLNAHYLYRLEGYFKGCSSTAWTRLPSFCCKSSYHEMIVCLRFASASTSLKWNNNPPVFLSGR